MRENFIINPDRNNGYPTFSDVRDFTGINSFKNLSMMQLCGNYPQYSGWNFEINTVKHYSKLTYFSISDINDGYPIWLGLYGLDFKTISDIYNRDKTAQLIYFKNQLVKTVYFREKNVYKLGFGK